MVDNLLAVLLGLVDELEVARNQFEDLEGHMEEPLENPEMVEQLLWHCFDELGTVEYMPEGRWGHFGVLDVAGYAHEEHSERFEEHSKAGILLEGRLERF